MFSRRSLAVHGRIAAAVRGAARAGRDSASVAGRPVDARAGGAGGDQAELDRQRDNFMLDWDFDLATRGSSSRR